MIEEIDTTSQRAALAGRLCDAIQHRWSAEVRAVGVCGSVAHGDDNESSDVDLVVITYRPRTGPKPAMRKVDGIPVDLRVLCAEEALAGARQLTARWPLLADRYMTTFGLHDPKDFFKELREAHQHLLTEARPAEFSQLARHNWAVANGARQRAVRLTQWYDTDAALVTIAEARVHAALVAGFLTRTWFRNPADAVKRTGVAAADMQELGAILKYQADELAARGRPVDGTLGALFD
ncbi:nucleotidyltransferase domain-containing protein [Actinoplanes oblitus]|uniref:Nucleotidyltransferase domain-containing protein n=1 Tax=Actinoplanes oblitus TaxID=3040509 RepID=A0ABY8WC11_9ACTN|nr:nucleotidyltransferase domain-containing protein [Actinoplanes oblitus]WIM95404.1 nucleotidyltransferase domain-containing protein [Actinoplanes oblitus]